MNSVGGCCRCCYSFTELKTLCGPALDVYTIISNAQDSKSEDTHIRACLQCYKFLKEVHHFKLECTAVNEMFHDNPDIKPLNVELLLRNAIDEKTSQLDIKTELVDKYAENDQIEVQINKVKVDPGAETIQQILESLPGHFCDSTDHDEEINSHKRSLSIDYDKLEQQNLQYTVFPSIETEKMKSIRNAKRRSRYAKNKNEETSEKMKDIRNAKQRYKHAIKRNSETAEMREMRLAKQRLKYAERRNKDTAEIRERRLSKVRLQYVKYKSKVTDENREKRRAKRRLQDAKRRSEESPEVREKRLARMRLRYAKIYTEGEEKEKRLAQQRLNYAKRQSKDSTEGIKLRTVEQCSRYKENGNEESTEIEKINMPSCI